MVEYSFSVPAAHEYNRLRTAVGWELVTERQFNNGVARSVVVSARQDGELVGFARTITDGGMLSLIVDVMVDPSAQRQGIGTHLMKMLLDYHENELQEGETSYVNVMATKERELFYKKLGFLKRPNLLQGAGMTLRMRAKRESE